MLRAASNGQRSSSSVDLPRNTSATTGRRDFVHAFVALVVIAAAGITLNHFFGDKFLHAFPHNAKLALWGIKVGVPVASWLLASVAIKVYSNLKHPEIVKNGAGNRPLDPQDASENNMERKPRIQRITWAQALSVGLVVITLFGGFGAMDHYLGIGNHLSSKTWIVMGTITGIFAAGFLAHKIYQSTCSERAEVDPVVIVEEVHRRAEPWSNSRPGPTNPDMRRHEAILEMNSRNQYVIAKKYAKQRSDGKKFFEDDRGDPVWGITYHDGEPNYTRQVAGNGRTLYLKGYVGNPNDKILATFNIVGRRLKFEQRAGRSGGEYVYFYSRKNSRASSVSAPPPPPPPLPSRLPPRPAGFPAPMVAQGAVRRPSSPRSRLAIVRRGRGRPPPPRDRNLLPQRSES